MHCTLKVENGFFSGTNFYWVWGEDVGFHAKNSYNYLPIGNHNSDIVVA